jgi:hypothetical protein
MLDDMMIGFIAQRISNEFNPQGADASAMKSGYEVICQPGAPSYSCPAAAQTGATNSNAKQAFSALS